MSNRTKLATTGAVKAAVTDANTADWMIDETDLGQYDRASAAVADKMTVLVKGVGYAHTDKSAQFGEGGNHPLTNPDAVFGRAMRATKAWKTAISSGRSNPDGVFKSLSPAFQAQFGAFLSQNPANMAMSQWVGNLQQQVNDALAGIGKSITLTTPLSTGLVPYNLVAPSRLIYPVCLN